MAQIQNQDAQAGGHIDLAKKQLESSAKGDELFPFEECSDTDMDMSLEAEGEGNLAAAEAKLLSRFDISDFECALCYKLFYQPVTTTCGHTYCKNCFLSSLKYSPHCPLCRAKLFDSPREFNISVNYLLLNILEKHFGTEYQARMLEETEEGKQRDIERVPEAVASEQEEWDPACPWWGSCASFGCVLLYQ
eukprot:TRINITY_DN7430_c0_g1_i1.p1 TRINITY_DN7430_c0_g1~~TRINITY_DN7430_c0_g1_i1.p1  ORF type:complete len:191 (-),score=49.70 TRINITY_DN7430_c0_g1_i1:127-699(-)